MEWAGLFCLMILLYYSSYPAKVKRMEKELSKIKRMQNGGLVMSKLISDLIGKKCKITNEDGSQNAWIYTILDADDEWVKVSYLSKKDEVKTEIIRIDSIKKVDLLAE